MDRHPGLAPGTDIPGIRERLTNQRTQVKSAMEGAGLEPDLAEITMRADNDIAVAGDTAQQVAKLLAWLEDLDDVQNVYSNADLGEDAYA